MTTELRVQRHNDGPRTPFADLWRNHHTEWLLGGRAGRHRSTCEATWGGTLGTRLLVELGFDGEDFRTGHDALVEMTKRFAYSLVELTN